MEPASISFQYGQHTVTFETGEIAKQATAAVTVKMGDTVVLVTVVANRESTGQDFLPLTVIYQERSYAGGRIPGGYFKREGRPPEKETLIARLIDRPIRPLFPEGFSHEVQLVATVLSYDEKVGSDIAAMLGASCVLALSGLPFEGPIGAARVGYIDGNYVLNPSTEMLKQSKLDLVVAGTDKAVLMVESEAKELSEEIMLASVLFGHEQMQVAIKAIQDLVAEAGKAKWDWQPSLMSDALKQTVAHLIEDDLNHAFQIQEKSQRGHKLAQIKEHAVTNLLANKDITEEQVPHVKKIVEELEYQVMRRRVLEGLPRIDGRDTKTVRPITIRLGVLPRTHGSALFTRGETQALVVVTLGTGRDAQMIESIEGDIKDTFLFHYNFPPYCVGEIGQMGSPKRREIGHGRLAKRGVAPVLPSQEAFSYVIRVVSEITESNGSSSMASVCGSSLALMDAGVPIKSPVAGIAMGLIKDGDKFAILTDILGDEDHLGDMDFKVAGTREGITALQMDIKINGITAEIMRLALEQAKAGRYHILGIMEQALPAARVEMSDYAPRIITIKINPDKIRDVIGKGGAVIRALTEETGATIDITDDGVVKIASVNREAGVEACRRIKAITEEAEVDKVYEGVVSKIADFGAFVNILPGKDGLVHISQIANERIANVTDVLSEGQRVRVKVIEIDKQGRVKLSMKGIDQA